MYMPAAPEYLLTYINLYIGQWPIRVPIGYWPKDVTLCLGVNQLKINQ